ncbi:MAG TPA: response regulator [Rhodothermales bacterium]|nr:response regulator [Rhodothermales bacterium]
MLKPLKSRTRRLLIVDDEPTIRYLLAHFLSQHYEVEVVASTDAALTLAAEQSFDVFLLDINLREEMTGFGLLQALRKRPEHEHTPAVACTACVNPYNLDKYHKGGFDGCVSKPFTRSSLSDMLTAVLHQPALFHDMSMTPHTLAA